MSFIHALRHRLETSLLPSRYERELEEEMRFHLSLDAMQAEREGASRREAHDVARRRFGNVTYFKEETRRMAGLEWLDTIRQDLRYAVRAFIHAPGFTLAAILTLALGIGATTAVFSVIDGVLLRGLAYRDADRLMTVLESRSDGGQRLLSYPTFEDWQRQSKEWGSAVEGLAFIRGTEAILVGERGPERLVGGYVSQGFFGLMATPAYIGRTFAPDEERRGANRVVVLSYDLWRQRFGGDPALVGKTIPLGGAPTTVLGVMPRGFGYPTWANLWMPIAVIEGTDSALIKRGVHSDSRAVARLRVAADTARATAALRTVAARLAREYPDEQANWTGVSLSPLRAELIGSIRPTLVMLGGAVLLVLLLACANVANLALARGSAREREVYVRAALGAGRGRLVRQMLTESLALALVGGAVGVSLAVVLVRLVRQMAPTQLPRVSEIAVDGRVMLFAVIASALAALLAGTVPAIRATRPAMIDRLRSGALGSVGTLRDKRLRGLLVSAQFALALILLIGAGLLVQSFRKLQAVSLGFEPSGRVAIAIFPPANKYGDPSAAAALYQRLMTSVRAVPGVRDAAVVNHIPVGGGWVTSPVQVAGRVEDATRDRQVLYRTASAEYQRVIGMRLVRGRWFSAEDMRSPSGFVINETMAKQVWPGGDAVGQTITLRRSSQGRPDFGQPITGTVLGVVGDVRQFGRENATQPEVYVPYTLEVWPWITLVIHADDAQGAIPRLRRAVLDVDPAIPVASDQLQGGFSTLDRQLSTSMAQRRFATSLLGTFAIGALLLAAVGMYGVIAYGVTQRTREVGVRMALGASERTILRLVVGEGVRLAIVGGALGLAGAFATTRLIRALLFDTVPTDPLTFVVTPVVLGAVALLASWLPARRASKLDPSLAIRGE